MTSTVGLFNGGKECDQIFGEKQSEGGVPIFYRNISK